MTIPVTATNDWALAGSPPPMVTLSPEASAVLGKAETAVQQAQALRDAILTGIVSQAGFRDATVVQVNPGPPMVLVLKV